ncbi:MAG: peptidylprolyl isomerase [Elusimicrobiaceae bacterium]|nr:peptidylprolyl isomerase [Elusimicrobiaceae bacterium]
MDIIKTAAAALCAATLACACSKKNETAPPEKPALARVGSGYITPDEYKAKITDVSARFQNYLATPSGKKQFLQILIREKLILAAAKDSEVANNPAFIQETRRMREDMETRFREFQDYTLTRMWLEELRKNGTLTVTDKEIQKYYNEYPEEYTIRHILCGSSAEATQVLKLAKSYKARFPALAKARSIDMETAANGGAVPPFIMGEFLPELEQPVARLRNDQPEGVFKSKFGYHVIKKDGERRLSFDDARERIARVLEKQKLDGYLKSIEEKYKVEVLDENYRY